MTLQPQPELMLYPKLLVVCVGIGLLFDLGARIRGKARETQ